MNLIPIAIVANLRRYLVRSICGLAIALSVWQGLSFGFDTTLAASAIGDNRATVIKQIAAKENLATYTAESEMDNSNNPAQSLLETAETGVKIDANKAEKASGDTPDIVKDNADRNSEQAESFSENVTKNIKKAFGS